MKSLDECFKYEPEIKRLTKANSLLVGTRVIYIVKKNHKGQANRFYIAYDYKTKVQLAFNTDKEALKEFLLFMEEDIERVFI